MTQEFRPRRTSLVFPILLMAVGGLFLYSEFRPNFDPWPVLSTYWPVLLIILGLAAVWDASRRRQNPQASPGVSAGSTAGILVFILVVAVFVTHGRGASWRHRTGRAMQHHSETVERQDARDVRVSIEMSAGDLTIGAGTSHLLDAAFDYRTSSEAPEVTYRVDHGSGELRVSDEDRGSDVHTISDNNWNLRLAGDLPVGLKINMGAGTGNLHLRDVDLSDFELHMGAGRIDLDLTGARTRDLHAVIQGGVGQATIRLPKNIGVAVTVSGGLGTVETHGLKHESDEYTNEAYGKSPTTLRLNVEGGVGQIRLIEE